jgi:hypothetical protein
MRVSFDQTHIVPVVIIFGFNLPENALILQDYSGLGNFTSARQQTFSCDLHALFHL